MNARKPAVFLDRDGTLNLDRSYILSPAQLALLPGVTTALKRLQGAGFVCVVVTNQSAVGRGLMTDADLENVHAEMNRQLAIDGVKLDAIYACTFAPASDDPLAIEHPDRKPAPGMLLRAATDLGLELAQSWMIGDTMRDILAGQNAGCRECVLVRTGQGVEEAEYGRARPFVVADDLSAAADYILSSSTAR
jgi:D-glycero-D-manno-heptose 1,7-bisphosphate phosphatase